MVKENVVSGNTILLHGRRTLIRAYVYARGAYLKLLKVSATLPNHGRVLRAKTKRTDLDDKEANEPKKRAVLKDITNVTCQNSDSSCFNVPVKKERPSSFKATSSSATLQVTDAKVEVVSNSGGGNEASFSLIASSRLPTRPLGTVERSCVGASSSVASSPKFVDIDSDYKDPLLCSLYAPDIHYNLRVAELRRRPSPEFMERTKRAVTPKMRETLVEWLVEVSEDYKLVPDTLYLTVYLIDWFLHENYVEIERLQLLGITCMLIASKYEEICAPRIEDFCFITDNTYTRDQVLEMERQVLKHFSFQIYAPTSKTFLRIFLRAAQASYSNPSLETEFLANYLTELTLIDYDFLKYLPSVIAASAVFLAKWTLNQPNHPWNPTLEHYTRYKASDLKAPVHALQDLQLNTKDSPVNFIRIKYRQEKFKSVAVFTSVKLPDRLFIS